MEPDPEILLTSQRFRVERVPERHADGALGSRDVIRHPGAVVMLPVLADGRLCLIRNRRTAVGKTLLELPAGTRDRTEPPEVTARRELLEETGYRAQRWRQLLSFFVSPGILDERMWLFLAEGLTPGPPQREPDEQIENYVCSRAEALAMVESGAIEDAKTLVGLLYYDRLARSP